MSTDWVEGRQAAHASASANDVPGQAKLAQQPAELSSSKHAQLQANEIPPVQRVRVSSDPMQLLVGLGDTSQQASGSKSIHRQPSATGIAEPLENGVNNAWGSFATGRGSSLVQNGKRVLQNGKVRNGMHGSSNSLTLLANGDIQQQPVLLSPDTPQSAQQLSPDVDNSQAQSPQDSSLQAAASMEPAGPLGNAQQQYSNNKHSRHPSMSNNGELGSIGSQQARRRSGTGQPGSMPGVPSPEGAPEQPQPPAAHRRPMMLGVGSDDSQGHGEAGTPSSQTFLLNRQSSGLPDAPASAPAAVAGSSQGHHQHHPQGPPSTTVSAPTTPSGGNHHQGPSPSHSTGRLSGSFSRDPGTSSSGGAGGSSSHRNSWGPSGGGGGGNNGGGGGMGYDRRGSRGSSYNNLPSMGNHQGGGGGKGYGGGVRNGYGKGGMQGRSSMDDTFLNSGMGHHGGGGHHHAQHTRSHSRGAHSGGPRGGGGGRDYSIQGELGSTGLGLQGWGPGVVPGGHEPSATTDLERFLIQVTPTIGVDPTSPSSLKGLSLEDVWRFYLEPSLYGREVYTLGGARGPSTCYFVPYLSAMQLFTPASPKDPGTNRLYICDTDGWPKHMHLRFEHFETELPFNRYPLYEQIGLLAQQHQQQLDAQQAAAATAALASAPAAVQEGAPTEASGGDTGAGASTSGNREPEDAVAGEGSGVQQPTGGSARSSMDGGAGGGSRSSSRAPSRRPSDNGTPSASAPAAPDSSASTSKPAGGTTASTSTSTSTGVAEAPSPSPPPPPVATTPPPPSMGGLAGLTTIPGLFHPPSLLRDLPIMELHPASWYAVAWYPVYRIPDAPLITRFLTFHSFAPVISTIQGTLASLSQQQGHQGTASPQGSEQQVGDDSQAAAAAAAAAAAGAGSGCPSPSPQAQASASTHPIPPPPPPPTPPPRHQTPPLPFSEPPQHLLPMGIVGLTWYNMHGERWLEPLAVHPEEGKVVSLLRVMEEAAPAHIPRSTSRRDIRLAAQQMDMHFTAHLRELQGTAERLARGYGLRMLGPMGAQELKLKHPDYEFFSSRS